MPVGVMISDCRASLDLVTIHGVEPERVRRFRDLRVPEEAWRAFETGESAALVGETIARRYGWKPGDLVSLPRLRGIAFTVRGIMPESGAATDSLIYVPLAFMQRSSLGQGIANQIWARLRPGEGPAEAARAIDEELRSRGTRTHTRPEEEFLQSTTADVRQVVRLAQVLAWIAVGVLLLAVANAISLAVRERASELAVMRTFGYTPALLCALVCLEGVAVSLLGGGVGVAAAAVALARSAVGFGVEGVVFRPDLGAAGILEGLVVAAAVGAFGALPAAWIATRRPIVQDLRRVD